MALIKSFNYFELITTILILILILLANGIFSDNEESCTSVLPEDSHHLDKIEINSESITNKGRTFTLRFKNSGFCYSKRFYLELTNHSVIGQFENGAAWKFALNYNTLYKLDHFHFHWGDDDINFDPNNNRAGSVHIIDGNEYPLEMHLVNIRNDMSDVEEALMASRPGNPTIIIFAITFDAGNFLDNKEFTSIQSTLHLMKEEGIDIGTPMTVLNGRLNMTNLFPIIRVDKENRRGNYLPAFTYEGPFRHNNDTTCPKNPVQWVVFKTPVNISMDQMEAFHNLWGPDDKDPAINVSTRAHKFTDEEVTSRQILLLC